MGTKGTTLAHRPLHTSQTSAVQWERESHKFRSWVSFFAPVATLKKYKKQVGSIFVIKFYSTHSFQNVIISTCSHYKTFFMSHFTSFSP